MKRITTIVIAVLTMVTIQGQTLTERQKGMAACAWKTDSLHGNEVYNKLK